MNTASRSDSLSPFGRIIWQLVLGTDWWLTCATFFLIAVGLFTLGGSPQTLSYFNKQVEFMWVGVGFFLLVSRISYRFFSAKPVVIVLYIVNLLLLFAVMVKGHSAQGAQRWLAIGPITLQPSEIAKLVVIFTLATWLGSKPITSFLDIFKLIAIVIPPAALVFLQPDLGTSLTFGAVFMGMSFWAGATFCDVLILISPLISLILNAINQLWWLGFCGVLALCLIAFWRRTDWKPWLRLIFIAIIVASNLAAGEVRPHLWHMLKDYQQKRLTSFVNPYSDPRGSGYHILQSLIAIGAGGITGSGLGKGNQSQGAFIPEKHTDFIFAVIGEELGFKICALVIIAYAIICFRGLSTAIQCKENLTGSTMAIGLTCMFLFHVFLNIGMTMGIMPVAGVPLPLLSYGGTALLVDLISIGLLQSIQISK